MEETSTTPAVAAAPAHKGKKRALELDESEPAFVASEDGAYSNVEMPKRINCGHMMDEFRSGWARMRAFDAEDERSTALHVRLMSESAAMVREMKAKAAARLSRVCVMTQDRTADTAGTQLRTRERDS